MIRNYIKTAWRTLWKNKLFSVINILGLSAGLAFALLIGAYIWNELQVNQGLRNASRQYILTSIWKDPNMGYELSTLGPLAKRLKEDYPGLVKNYYRVDNITSIVSKGDKHLRESIQLCDSTLLSVYGFQLLYGDAHNALAQPYSIVITQAMAIKYFGKKDVIGQLLSIQSFAGDNHDFTVTGVLNDYADNSITHLTTANTDQFFIPLTNYTYFGRFDPDSWVNVQMVSYIELAEGVSRQLLGKAVEQLLRKNTPDHIQKNLMVRPVPLPDYYLRKDNALVKRMLYTLSFIGFFVLLMAVINFINIAISSAGSRTREIGIRKVLGSLRSQLVIQFLSESLILVSISTLIALAAYPLMSIPFGALTGKEMPLPGSFSIQLLAVTLATVFTVALLAGLYPAFVLSSLKTVDSLKGKLKGIKENILLRKSLVGLQFFIALVVLIATAVVTQQVAHFFGLGLGYNKAFVVSSQVPRDWSVRGIKQMTTIRNELALLPQVSDITLSYAVPDGNSSGQAAIYSPGTDSTLAITMQVMQTDEHYLSVYQVPLAGGSFFNGGGQDSGKVILNAQAARALGYNIIAEAVGKQLRIPGDPTVFTVKGVTTDFHFGSMREQVAPLLFFHVQFSPVYRFLSFKIKPDNIPETIAAIQRKWAQLLPGSSFEYAFMDDRLAAIYISEIQLKKAAYVSTVLALIIMLLGVLGLISLSIQKRIKEIGIRKVLGSSVTGIIGLFVKEFMIIIVAAAVIAIPAAGLLMNNWLDNYADRISLSVQPFITAVFVLAAVTLLVICLQTMKAAFANPVKSLRNE